MKIPLVECPERTLSESEMVVEGCIETNEFYKD